MTRAGRLLGVALAVSLATACGPDRRGRGLEDGGAPLADGDVASPDGSPVADAGPAVDGGETRIDGGMGIDGSTGLDAGDPDAGTIDRSITRTTVPFRVYGWDIDREGDFVAVGRSTVGEVHTGYYCSGPSYRNGSLDDGVPTAAIVRRSRSTSETAVAYQLSGAAGLRVWFFRAIPSSCDLAGSAPPHMFDGEWVDGSFEAEAVFAMDVTDAGDAWVVSQYRGENRLTRFEHGVRREQLDLGSCSFGLSSVEGLAIAIEPGTGAGVVACSGYATTTTAGLFVRRFAGRALVDPSWVPVAGTAGAFGIQTFDVAMTAAGEIALARVDTILDSGSFRYERFLTTLTSAGGARGSASLGAHGTAFMQIDGFVRDRGAPADFVLVLRPEGTLTRYAPDATAGSSATGGPLAATPVLADRHGRTYVLDGADIVRNGVPLP